MRCSTPSSAEVVRRGALAVTLFVGVAAAQPPADAGSSTQRPPVVAGDAPTQVPSVTETQARLAFEEAQRHYDVGRFADAIEAYTRAYDALPLPALLFNIAQCHRHLGRYEEAAFFYRRYLDLADEPANTAVATDLLTEMEARARKQKTEAQAREALTASPRSDGNAEASPPPWYRRWWVWAVAGGVIVAGATAATVHATQPPAPTLGTVNGR